MNIDTVKKFLDPVHRGAHTIQGFLKPQALVPGGGKGADKKISVYLFPNTLIGDHTVITYCPASKTFQALPLVAVNCVKVVEVFKEKQELAEQKYKRLVHFAEEVHSFIGRLDEATASMLRELTAMISEKQILSDRQYIVAKTILRRLATERPEEEIIEEISDTLEQYYRYCRTQKLTQLRQETVQLYLDTLEKSVLLSHQDNLEVGDLIEACESATELPIKDVAEVVRTKVLLQIMMLTSLECEKDLLTFVELLEFGSVFRPDIFDKEQSDKFKLNIKSALKCLITDGFVEYSDIMDTYSLSKQGKTLAVQLMEIDNKISPKE